MALATVAAGALARCTGVSLLPAAQRLFSTASLDEKLTVEVIPFRTHRIDAPSNVVETSLAELLSIYEVMKTMRSMEIAADLMYKAKMIRGFCHLYDGQEAVAVGMEYAITRQDSIITSYRDHCQHISRGGSVKQVMAELFGRKTGATHGIGGSMHMYNKKANFYGGNGIVGAQVPLGAGLALAHKYKKDNSVAFAMYGDGAANQGQLFEAFNIAGLWNLPVIFVCENNHYGMGTAEWRAARSTSFFARGDYIPGIKADGMDVLAVKQVCKFAKEYVLQNGPIILEMDTYRYHGHSMSDPGSTYRDRTEISSVRQERDPIERVKKLLLSLGYDANELKKKDKAIKAVVDAAVNEAKGDEVPPDSWLWKNVYADAKHATLRTVSGEYIHSDYDPAYTR